MPEPEGPSAMSPKSEDAKALSADIIAPDAIAAWLKRNPGFLNDHPDVLAALVPPESDHGKGVLDMQRFMLERLQRDLADKHDREQALLAATRRMSMPRPKFIRRSARCSKPTPSAL